MADIQNHEYRHVKVNDTGTPSQVETALNKLSDEGWEIYYLNNQGYNWNVIARKEKPAK